MSNYDYLPGGSRSALCDACTARNSSFFILHFQHCKGTKKIPYWQAFSQFVSELFEMLKWQILLL